VTETLDEAKATTMKEGMILSPTPEFAASIAQPLGLDIPPPEIEWLTVKQAACILQVTTRTIRSMIAEGRLPACRVCGTIIRINRRALNECFDPFSPTDYGGEDEG